MVLPGRHHSLHRTNSKGAIKFSPIGNLPDCPIPNNCLAENVVYNAILESEGKAYSYYGMTSQTFKKRYGQHKHDFKHEKGEDNGTALSAKVWKLKKEEKNYSIKWSIVDKAFPYKAGGKMCDLCSTERMYIALAQGKNAFAIWAPAVAALPLPWL